MKTGMGKETAVKLFIKNLLNLIGFLLDVIRQKEDELQPKYKLVDWIEKNGLGYCKVHVIGTCVVNDFMPSEIVGDDAFISGFSKFDIRTLTNLANAELLKPKAIISSINYEKNNIEIKETGKETVTLKVDENLEKIIEKLSKKDIYNIGRLVGENDSQI